LFDSWTGCPTNRELLDKRPGTLPGAVQQFEGCWTEELVVKGKCQMQCGNWWMMAFAGSPVRRTVVGQTLAKRPFRVGGAARICGRARGADRSAGSAADGAQRTRQVCIPVGPGAAFPWARARLNFWTGRISEPREFVDFSNFWTARNGPENPEIRAAHLVKKASFRFFGPPPPFSPMRSNKSAFGFPVFSFLLSDARHWSGSARRTYH
jgi:hypothetical protein